MGADKKIKMVKFVNKKILEIQNIPNSIIVYILFRIFCMYVDKKINQQQYRWALYIMLPFRRYVAIGLGYNQQIKWKRLFEISFHNGLELNISKLKFIFEFSTKYSIHPKDFSLFDSTELNKLLLDIQIITIDEHAQTIDDIFRNEKYYPDVYKNFYIKKYLKIYNDSILQNPSQISIEIALPFLYYFQITFEKSYYLFNFTLVIGNPFLTIELLKRRVSFSFGKNYLARNSNLYNCAAMDRYFLLKGNRHNKYDDSSRVNPFYNLAVNNKFPQFKNLMKYMDVLPYLQNPKHWGFSGRFAPKNGMNEFLYELAQKNINIPVMPGEINPKAEDEYVTKRIKMCQQKIKQID